MLVTTLRVESNLAEGDFVQVKKDICVGATDRRNLEFFFFAQGSRDWAPDRIVASVSVNDKEVWSQDLIRENRVRKGLVQQILPENQCGTLAVKLELAQKDSAERDRQTMDFHMIFPRLARPR
jgi:hypothetical protein